MDADQKYDTHPKPGYLNAGVDEVRQRALAAGLTIPEDRLPAFAESVSVLRAVLEPLRRDLARYPAQTVFGGSNVDL